jgi:hypothetical protein
MFGQQLFIDARVIVEAVELCIRSDPQQIVVAGIVLSQQQQV